MCWLWLQRLAERRKVKEDLAAEAIRSAEQFALQKSRMKKQLDEELDECDTTAPPQHAWLLRLT